MKIDEPKTPYNGEDQMDEDSMGDAGGTGGSGGTVHISEDVHMSSHSVNPHILTKEEEEIKKHLEEAERNK